MGVKKLRRWRYAIGIIETVQVISKPSGGAAVSGVGYHERFVQLVVIRA
jgi:hypothetical protein